MEIPSFEVATDHPLATAARAATADAGGPDLPAAGWTAACDGGYLMRDTGIPTVVLGPGSVVGQAHRPDESVAVDEVGRRGARVRADRAAGHLSALTVELAREGRQALRAGLGDHERLGGLEAPVVHPHPADHVERHPGLELASCRPGRRLIVCSPQSGG